MGNRWLILAALTTARLAMGFQFQSVGSTALFLVDEFPINFTDIGFLVGLFLLPGIFLAVPAGIWGKRYGDKRIVSLGLFFMAVGGVIIGASNSYEMICAGRVVSGVGAVLLNVLLTKMITDWFAGREIVLAMSTLLNAWPIGVGLALVVQGSLAEWESWSLVFHTTAGFAAVSLVIVAAFYRPPEDVASAPAGGGLRNLSRTELVSISTIGMTWALFNAAIVILWAFAPSLLAKSGMSTTEAGFMVSISTWLMVVSVQAGGLIVQRFGHGDAVIVIGALVSAGGLFILPLVDNPLWVLIVMGLFIGAPAGAINAIPAEILKPENRAPGLGVYIIWYYFAMAALPPVAGALQTTGGDLSSSLYFAGFVMLAAIPFLWVVRWRLSNL